MKKYILFIFLLSSVFTFAGIKKRRVEKVVQNGEKKKYALIIGIADYKNFKNREVNKEDIKELATILGRDGYEVTLLDENKELTKDNIEREIEKLESIKENSQILIYYSGHLESRSEIYKTWEKSVYMIPNDGDKLDEFSFISLDEIKYSLRAMDSKQILIIFDSDDIGGFIDIYDTLLLDDNSAKEKRVIQVINLGRRSNGEFLKTILKSFKTYSGDYNLDYSLSGDELAFFLKKKLNSKNRTILSGKLKSYDEGSFEILNLKKSFRENFKEEKVVEKVKLNDNRLESRDKVKDDFKIVENKKEISNKKSGENIGKSPIILTTYYSSTPFKFVDYDNLNIETENRGEGSSLAFEVEYKNIFIHYENSFSDISGMSFGVGYKQEFKLSDVLDSKVGIAIFSNSYKLEKFAKVDKELKVDTEIYSRGSDISLENSCYSISPSVEVNYNFMKRGYITIGAFLGNIALGEVSEMKVSDSNGSDYIDMEDYKPDLELKKVRYKMGIGYSF